jgi:hypothetical protein
VRIRSRKPWVFDRRRLFGWNVRLLTRYSYDTTSAVAPPPVGGRARGAGRAGADADPVTPGSWSLCTGTLDTAGGHAFAGRVPSTDSDQHSRGTGCPGARPGSDSPACTRRPARGTRRAGAAPADAPG